MVNLWAQWCTPCKRELAIYQRFYERHRATVSVLGWERETAVIERWNEACGA